VHAGRGASLLFARMAAGRDRQGKRMALRPFFEASSIEKALVA
jgi:hypothetical protein